MHFKTFFSSLAVVAVFASPAIASEGHEHAVKPMYGGVLAATNDINYELVVKADSLTLYVVDHGKPVATTGAKANATVFAGSDKTTVALEPAGDNKMVAKGSFRSGLGVRVAVDIALPGKPQAKVNFRLK